MVARTALALALALLATAPVSAQSERLAADASVPGWQGGFGASAVALGSIADWAVFDDGSGPAVYAAGAFLVAGDRVVNGVARWGGARWEPVGSGFGNAYTFHSVLALEAFDDGSGHPALYAAGQEEPFQTASPFA